MSVVIVNGTDIPTFLFTFCFTISPLFLFVCIFLNLYFIPNYRLCVCIKVKHRGRGGSS